MSVGKFFKMFLGVLIYSNALSLFTSVLLFLTQVLSSILSFGNMFIKMLLLSISPIACMFLLGLLLKQIGMPSPFSLTGALAFGKKVSEAGGSAMGGASSFGGKSGKGGRNGDRKGGGKQAKSLGGQNAKRNSDVTKNRLARQKAEAQAQKQKARAKGKAQYKDAKRQASNAKSNYRKEGGGIKGMLTHPFKHFGGKSEKLNHLKNDIQASKTFKGATKEQIQKNNKIVSAKSKDDLNKWKHQSGMTFANRMKDGAKNKLKLMYSEARHGVNNKIPVLGSRLNAQINRKEMIKKGNLDRNDAFHDAIQKKRIEKNAQETVDKENKKNNKEKENKGEKK